MDGKNICSKINYIHSTCNWNIWHRCGTCVKDAKKGQPGFCVKKPRRKDRFRSRKRGDRKSAGKPTFTENWGMCSDQCLPGYDNRATALQVSFVTHIAERFEFLFAPEWQLFF